MGKGNPLIDENISEYRMNPATVKAIEKACVLAGVPKDRFRILDFGCGRGRAVVYLRSLGYDAHGVDVDRIPVGHGRDYLMKSGLAPVDCLSVVGLNGEGLAENAFDFCYSDQVLEHVANLPAVARALAHSLRNNGRGLHIFPSKWRPIEPHIKMPFFHWLPREAAIRRAAGMFWLLLRFDPHWKEAEGRNISQRSQLYAEYTLQKTHYRSLNEISEAFERHGLFVQFPVEKGWLGLGWLKRTFGSVKLEILKPANRGEAPEGISGSLVEKDSV